MTVTKFFLVITPSLMPYQFTVTFVVEIDTADVRYILYRKTTHEGDYIGFARPHEVECIGCFLAFGCETIFPCCIYDISDVSDPYSTSLPPGS